MQHGKNGGRGVVVQSAWTWWTTAFVTLLLMAATKWMSGYSAMASQNCLPLDDEAWTPSSCSALAVDGNLTPNCSTDWAVSPISRGGEPGQATKPLDSFWAAAAGQDVPSRCPMMMMMTTHSARSSWLPNRLGVFSFFSFLSFFGCVGINERDACGSVNIWTTLAGKTDSEAQERSETRPGGTTLNVIGYLDNLDTFFENFF